jgi:hypothetical protein
MKRRLTRNWFQSVVTGLFVLAMVGTANAARVHFKSDPTFEDLGNTLDTCLSLAGLGHWDVTITVAVTGEATVLYINPGSNEPPGQNKVPISAVTTQTFPSTEIKNGNLSVCLDTSPVAPPPGPNPNWTVEVQDVAFFTATITVVQRGKVVLEETFQLDN